MRTSDLVETFWLAGEDDRLDAVPGTVQDRSQARQTLGIGEPERVIDDQGHPLTGLDELVGWRQQALVRKLRPWTNY